MRVLLVSDAYPPIIGGATRAAQQLGRQLTKRGHTVAVATAWQRNLPAFESDGGVEVHRLRGLVSRFTGLSADNHRYTPPPFPDPELAWRLRRLVRRFKPDLVHSYGWLTYSLLPALAGERIPLVLAAREYGNVCAVRTLVRQGSHAGEVCDGPEISKCLDCARGFYSRPKAEVAVFSVLIGRRALRHSMTAMHSTSTFTRGIMHRHLLGRGSVFPDVVIPDFREDDLVAEPDGEILASLPLEPYILFVGSFRRIKGDQLLLDAYRSLSNAPPLVMIGARSPEPMPELPSNVTAVFNVPHDTVMAAWDRALFGVFPSVVPEALGNVVHEAMSRGRAVIGTKPGGHTDMIVDGETGILVPAGDVDALSGALRRLLSDVPSRERMGALGQERAALFTADVAVPQIEALYSETAAKARRRLRTPGSGVHLSDLRRKF